jgi:uncharacterized membrane protein
VAFSIRERKRVKFMESDDVAILAAFIFGIVAGLRTFTAEAVYFGLRGGIAGIVFPIFAIAEYIADALPQTPARTAIAPLAARCVSGAFMGWITARTAGAIVGIAGALLGTFGGYRARMWAIAALGPVPSAIVEDIVAIMLAVGSVTLLD